MGLRINKVSNGFLVAMLTFTVGVAITLAWLTMYRQPTVTQKATDAPITLINEEPPLPTGWKNLVVKNRVTLNIPQDMKPAELIGDSPNYREAYNNREIYLAVMYGEFIPCDTPHFLLESPRYHESVIEIDGKKARLGVDSFYRPEFVNARLCFLDADDSGMQLNIAASCKHEQALQNARRIFTSIRFTDTK
jgi:hypothetical protein